MDIITKLPVGIIETILCFLPIQEAARTSILSREWRYRWIKIPKLVFSEYGFQESTNRAELSVLEQTFDEPSKRKKMARRCKFFYAIYQVLLIHEGPIHEFTLAMSTDGSCVEIDHIILHLSKKNTLKMLDLEFMGTGYKLPLSLFSLHQLTELHLWGCALNHQPSSYEFGSLTTLYLEEIWACGKKLLHLLSSCPLLKSLIIDSTSATISDCGIISIADLFECLPVIEDLYVSFYFVKCFVLQRLPKEIPTALVHLKYLYVLDVCFSHIYWLPFLALLIRSSPNLEKLELSALYDELEEEEDEMGSFTLEDYPDIMLEHLKELEIRHFRNKENELVVVKLLLVKSPVLKKARISVHYEVAEDEQLQISKILLSCPCASPMAKIIVS